MYFLQRFFYEKVNKDEEIKIKFFINTFKNIYFFQFYLIFSLKYCERRFNGFVLETLLIQNLSY